jgi:hypothetical protein
LPAARRRWGQSMPCCIHAVRGLLILITDLLNIPCLGGGGGGGWRWRLLPALPRWVVGSDEKAVGAAAVRRSARLARDKQSRSAGNDRSVAPPGALWHPAPLGRASRPCRADSRRHPAGACVCAEPAADCPSTVQAAWPSASHHAKPVCPSPAERADQLLAPPPISEFLHPAWPPQSGPGLACQAPASRRATHRFAGVLPTGSSGPGGDGAPRGDC